MLAILLVAFANKEGLFSKDTLLSFEKVEDVEDNNNNVLPSYVSMNNLSESGHNHKVLKNGIGYSFANQVKEPNTVYEIRHVFDLNKETVSIPENCVLLFTGGMLKNGTIVGNNTYLEGRAESILVESLAFKDVDKFHIDGISFPKGKDISSLAQRMLDVFNVLELQTGTYYFSSPLIVKNYFAKIDGAGKRTIITSNRKIDYAIRTVFDSEVKKPGKYYNASFIEISDLMIDGGKSKRIKNGIFLDGPSCTVSNCYITNIESVGLKLCEWCNNLLNCVITHCDIGALITRRANAVNVCYNRIESNNVNLVVEGYRGVNISKNTLEGGADFNIAVGRGYGCNVKDNYFEGYANSLAKRLTTTENRSLEFTGNLFLKSILWIGPIELKEKNGITEISYKVGNKNAPSTVYIEGNYIDIHREDNTTDPQMYFALIGSCLDRFVLQENTLTHAQNAVCGFFDTDNAVLGNAEILNNFVSGTAIANNSLDCIYDKYSKTGWRAKNHFVGKLHIDGNDK